MDAASLRATQARRFLLRLTLVGLAAAAIDLGAIRLLDQELSRSARIVVALLPLPGCLGLIAVAVQGIRLLEFQRRVQFEAVVLSFLATAVGVLVYGYLQKIWVFMLVFYGVGYVIAASHYR